MSAAAGRHERGVLDTNTVIMLRRLDDPQLLPAQPLITAVTLAELSVGPLVATTDEERAARQAHVQQAEADFEPLPFDAQAARTFGRVAASLRVTHQSAGPFPTATDLGPAAHRIAVDADHPLHGHIERLPAGQAPGRQAGRSAA